MELLKAVREAVGFAEPLPEDPVREDELSVVRLMQVVLSDRIRPVVVEQWLRVCGDGVRRIDRRPNPHGGAPMSSNRCLRAGMTTAQMLAAQADLGSRGPKSVHGRRGPDRRCYRGQQEHAWTRAPSRMSRERWNGPVC